MASQKHNIVKYCIKCQEKLTAENWPSYSSARGSYLCQECLFKQIKIVHDKDSEYYEKQKNRIKNRVLFIFNYYGNECAECGEKNISKLTIDHINGNGNAHRRQIGNRLSEWLFVNKNLMDGYQLLCYNCNCSKDIQYKDKYNLQNKITVMNAYGGSCPCGENRIERLTIDHANNDGAEQRKKLGCSTGSKMYRWLIKNNFPNNLGLQVLCYNCNCSKKSMFN